MLRTSSSFALGILCTILLIAPGCTNKEKGRKSKLFGGEMTSSHSVPTPLTERDFIGAHLVEKMIENDRARLAQPLPPLERAALLEHIGSLYATAERHLSEAEASLTEARQTYLKEGQSEPALLLLPKIGILHMRMGELANCARYHNRDSCLFPLSRMAQHRDRKGVEGAKAFFAEYLKERPDDTHVRWLLNVADQALGEKSLREWGKRAADPDFPRYPDVGGTVGLQREMRGGGGVVPEDFNGDGFVDLVVTSMLYLEPVKYFVNDGRGGFRDESVKSGLAKESGGLNVQATDYDNDGRLDLYLMRAGRGLLRNEAEFNSLLRNMGDGTFRNVTKEVGILGEENKNVASVWADFDGDGWLDLFVCNENRGPDFFRNLKGTFTPVLKHSKVTTHNLCGGAVAGDVDNDGDQDLFVTDLKGRNQLWLNNGDMSFRPSGQAVLESGPFASYGAGLLDYDNDGWLDIFIPTLDINISHMIRDAYGLPHPGDHQRLYRNTGGGIYEDVTEAVGLNQAISTMGANFGDLDNDGWLDIFLGTGAHSLGDLVPNIVFRNRGGQRFTDVSIAGGFASLQKAHGIGFSDFDNDGQPDVAVSMGGPYNSDAFFPMLHHNPGSPNQWVVLQLVGVQANRPGIGARVKATLVEDGKERQVHRTVGKGATYGTSSLQVHLGLGRATALKSVEILWPGQKEPQRFSDVAMNRYYRAKQGQARLEPLTRKKIAGFGVEKKPGSGTHDHSSHAH